MEGFCLVDVIVEVGGFELGRVIHSVFAVDQVHHTTY